MASYNLNEVLKKKKAAEVQASSSEVKLDDVSRVKVLSPGRQVFNRFVRNRLAVFGSVTLIVLFIFCFIGPLLYPYGQKQIFYKYEEVNAKLGVATQSTTYTGYVVDDKVSVNTNANNNMTTWIKALQSSNQDMAQKLGEDGRFYQVQKLGEYVYTLSVREAQKVASFGSTKVKVGAWDPVSKSFLYGAGIEKKGEAFETKAASLKGQGSFTIDGIEYTYQKGKVGKNIDVYTVVEGFHYEAGALSTAFEAAAEKAEQEQVFTAEGKSYVFVSNGDSNDVYEVGEAKLAKVFSPFVIDLYDSSRTVSEDFRINALLAAYTASSFTADGETYTLTADGDEIRIFDASGKEYGDFSTFIIRRNNGDDTIDYSAKMAIREGIEAMLEAGQMEGSLVTDLPQQTEDGKYDYDENGNLRYVESEIRLKKTDRNYELWANQVKYVIDRYASPSSAHFLGTDGDGFDVFARVMYGGRVSLMVGFVVVFLECFIGIIMGGLAGYYGGWVDNIIMRMVDIFYCLPSMPIMIILGGIMDAQRLDVYSRLFIMMAALGIMGWAGTARLVRGQILSFREQEFMVAAEATGIKVRARIFKHLIPNVMPQLIVSATMGMGGTILTESTLSFLGLGVKHPLATWGTMINSVSSASAMAHYAYIWIPVGLLICFTVIAFNFAGDGLRDAYDPKGKR